MRRFLSVVGVMTLCALLWVGAVQAAEQTAASESDAITNCQPLESVIFKTSHTTGDFCDKTADHGTSKSCEAEGIANGTIKCANGKKPFQINCSVGQACENGHWCSCKFQCPN